MFSTSSRQVGQRDRGGRQTAVVGVGAHRRGEDHLVGDAARLVVVDARDGDRLGHVPVGRREGQAGRRDGPLRRVARAQVQGHVGRRLGGQHDRELRRVARLARDQTRRRGDPDVGQGAHQRQVARPVDRLEGLPGAVVQAAVRGELARLRGEGDDRERVAGLRREAIDQADVERAAERGGAGDGELIELAAGREAAELHVEDAVAILREIAVDRQRPRAVVAGTRRRRHRSTLAWIVLVPERLLPGKSCSVPAEIVPVLATLTSTRVSWIVPLASVIWAPFWR